MSTTQTGITRIQANIQRGFCNTYNPLGIVLPTKKSTPETQVISLWQSPTPKWKVILPIPEVQKLHGGLVEDGEVRVMTGMTITFGILMLRSERQSLNITFKEHAQFANGRLTQRIPIVVIK